MIRRAVVTGGDMILEVEESGDFRIGTPTDPDGVDERPWWQPSDELFAFELVTRSGRFVAVGFSFSPVDVEVRVAGSPSWKPAAPAQLGSVWACSRPAGSVDLRITNSTTTVIEHRPDRRPRSDIHGM